MRIVRSVAGSEAGSLPSRSTLLQQGAKTHPGNIVVFGNARFSVLFDRLIRMEWSEDGVFCDDLTLSVCNRRTPECSFRTTVRGNQLVIDTGRVVLKYTDDGRMFHRGNLSAQFSVGRRTKLWRSGDRQSGNLGGTLRTLDNMIGSKKAALEVTGNEIKIKPGVLKPAEMCHGFISRDGWAVIDDTGTCRLKDKIAQGGKWVAPPAPGRRLDLYLLAFGLDFASALRDASAIWGRQPLPPRYAFGYWYSRYWAYTDREIEKLVDEFELHSIPLDVLVVDMDWHKPGWTGYTFSPEYFPDPAEFLAYLKSKKLKITFNLHPAKGVGKHEDAFPEMCRAMGLDPARTDCVPFDCTDPKFMKAYFRCLHHPLEKMGVDFWWMDWQQGTATSMKGLDPLPWLNQLHWEDLEHRKGSKRPVCFSRFGGLGAGRYPIGFSGDTISVWESLAFQPRFTATAANILYGYWSHDIGGHMPGPIDPELYARWMQFGLYSPVLRTHTTKNRYAERRVFEYPQPYKSSMISTIRRRYELLPYIYSECRYAYDTGLSLVRPLYHQWPEDRPVYRAGNGYLFGRKMIVAPVTAPADKETGLSRVRFYLPPGVWIDSARGEFMRGGKWFARDYLLEEIPVFVRPGTIIPCQKTRSRIEEGSYRDLAIEACPGDGAYDLYEDDGVSSDYSRGRFAIIPMSQKQSGNVIRVKIGKAEGRFRGFLVKRPLEIRLAPSKPPVSVEFNGKRLPFIHRLAKDGWRYDGDAGCVVVRLPWISLERDNSVSFRFDGAAVSRNISGWKGVMARLAQIGTAVNSVSCWDPLHPDERLAAFAAQTGNRIGLRPSSFDPEVEALRSVLKRLPRVLREYEALYLEKHKRTDQAAVLRKARQVLASVRVA